MIFLIDEIVPLDSNIQTNQSPDKVGHMGSEWNYNECYQKNSKKLVRKVDDNHFPWTLSKRPAYGIWIQLGYDVFKKQSTQFGQSKWYWNWELFATSITSWGTTQTCSSSYTLCCDVVIIHESNCNVSIEDAAKSVRFVFDYCWC